MRSTVLSLLALLLAWPLLVLSEEQAPRQSAYLTAEIKAVAAQLINQALTDSTAYDVVESLTTEVGARLAGTAAEARARAWAVGQLNELGFANVRVEPFDVRLWTRQHESAAIVEPFPQPLQVTALGHSVATPEHGVTAEIVRFATLDDLKEAAPDSLSGKIAFVDEGMMRTQDGSGYGLAVQKRSGAAQVAARLGAVAALIRSVGTSGHRFAHTGAMRYLPEAPKIPAAALSAPDADQLARALQRGPVTVHLHLDVTGGGRETSVWEGAPEQMAESGNVIAEVPGQTDDIILLGAHLDSWDLGTGAIDDGAGIGIITAAARLIQQLPQKPRRTIRIVYFGSEEVGIGGAKAYVDAHGDEMARHIVAAESDFGARKIWRMQTAFAEEQLEKAKAFFRVLRPLNVTPGNNEARGGPDLTFIREAGVPVVSLNQNGWDYFDYHHTADDTLDKIDPEELAQNVAVYAVFIWLASELPGDFGRLPVEE